MQKMIPFSPLLIDALKFNLMFKNAYNPPSRKDIFSLPNAGDPPSNQISCERKLKERKRFDQFYTSY